MCIYRNRNGLCIICKRNYKIHFIEQSFEVSIFFFLLYNGLVCSTYPIWLVYLSVEPTSHYEWWTFNYTGRLPSCVRSFVFWPCLCKILSLAFVTILLTFSLKTVSVFHWLLFFVFSSLLIFFFWENISEPLVRFRILCFRPQFSIWPF